MASPQCITFQSEYSLKSVHSLEHTNGEPSCLDGSAWECIAPGSWSLLYSGLAGPFWVEGKQLEALSHEAPMSGCLVGVLGSMDAQCENVL